MERLLFECAVRAIFIATGTAVALSVMRIKNVVARHQAWTGVVLSMLMLPLWTAFGYQVPIRVLSPRAQQAEVTGTVSAETVPVVITQTNDRPLAISKGDAKTSSMNWRQFMPGIYLFGCLRIAASAGNGYRRRVSAHASGPARTGASYQFVMSEPNHCRMAACCHDPAGRIGRMGASKTRCRVGA